MDRTAYDALQVTKLLKVMLDPARLGNDSWWEWQDVLLNCLVWKPDLDYNGFVPMLQADFEHKFDQNVVPE